MLKRGKNRPAPAVLRAELEGLARTFGRRIPVRTPMCPFPGCRETPAPLFCATHWGLVDRVMRRELLAELRAMEGRGQRVASPKMRELFKITVRDIQMALYRQAGAARVAAARSVGLQEQFGEPAPAVLGPDGQPVRPG